MLKSQSNSKSSLTLSLLIACLVISTLVVVSHYFFRPGLESEIKRQITLKLHSYNIMNAVVDVSGTHVVIKGVTSNALEAQKIATDVQNISGVQHLESKLLIETEGQGSK